MSVGCVNCGEQITRGPLPGDRSLTGWYHTGSGSELCGPVNDESDERVAVPPERIGDGPALTWRHRFGKERTA